MCDARRWFTGDQSDRQPRCRRVALRFRSAGRYVKERATRLLVPFIFGVLVLVPPQSYLGLRSHSDYAGSFLAWYPRFFQLIPKDMEGYCLGGHTWGHLWFILHLFVY